MSKRTAAQVLVDPDTQREIENAKKPKIALDANRKYKCLKSIVEMHDYLLGFISTDQAASGSKDKLFPTGQAMEVDTESAPKQPPSASVSSIEEAARNITTGNTIISVIFTLHNTARQQSTGFEGNMGKKTSVSAFKIRFRGQDYPLVTATITTKWAEILKANELEYKKFPVDSEENWYGTMGPYLDMFAVYSHRYNEVRVGHSKMVISKTAEKTTEVAVSSYGLEGRHHVLLEGITFPPERRSSIVQSLGPMTAWICMLRNKGIYRKKYAVAVKRAMAHVPGIDDILALVETQTTASETKALTSLLADILLITTSREATRMFFPITIFASVWREESNKEEFSKHFSTTGAGGWYTYKKAAELGKVFSMSGTMMEEQAQQCVFHSIFGTFKEDLSILSQITEVGKWYTREQLNKCFQKQNSSKQVVKFSLIKVSKYAKMAVANQTGLLTSSHSQATTIPCFSGKRTHNFTDDFIEQMQKKSSNVVSGKSMQQIYSSLLAIHSELINMLRKEGGSLSMGTTKWRDMGSLTLTSHGDELEDILVGKSIMFLGDNSGRI